MFCDATKRTSDSIASLSTSTTDWTCPQSSVFSRFWLTTGVDSCTAGEHSEARSRNGSIQSISVAGCKHRVTLGTVALLHLANPVACCQSAALHPIMPSTHMDHGGPAPTRLSCPRTAAASPASGAPQTAGGRAWHKRRPSRRVHTCLHGTGVVHACERSLAARKQGVSSSSRPMHPDHTLQVRPIPALGQFQE